MKILKVAKSEDYKHSPKDHGFFDECVRKNKDKDNPEGYCASIIDKAKGTTKWREGPKKSKTLSKPPSHNKELKMGIEVEKEHVDIYNELKKKYNIDMTLEEFSERIAKDHLKELSDYYTRLKKMESE